MTPRQPRVSPESLVSPASPDSPDSRWWLRLLLLLGGPVGWSLVVVLLQGVVRQTWVAVHLPNPGADDVISLGAAALGLGLCLWLAIGALLTLLAILLPQSLAGCRAVRGLAELVAPALLRRAIALALGVVLVGSASPALAASAPADAQVRHAVTISSSVPTVVARVTGSASGALNPGWVPAPETAGGSARTGGRHRAEPQSTSSSAAALDPRWHSTRVDSLPGTDLRPGVSVLAEVVVHRGDTLWDIAARHLGPSATDAEIAAMWPRWFEANRVVIGPSPDHLRPGDRLRPPPATPSITSITSTSSRSPVGPSTRGDLP